MDEIIDIFDQNYRRIGTASKSHAHQKGLWHNTFQCWIVRKRENNHYILFQKRAESKEDSPGLLDISAAGHLCAGESKEDGVREMKEEIGLDVKMEDMVYLGIRVAEYSYKHLRNKEFCFVFLLEDNTSLHEYILQENEVESIVEVDIHDALELFNGEVKMIKGNEFADKGNKSSLKSIEVQESDFVHRNDPYYVKICNLALQYFEGITYDKSNLPWDWKQSNISEY